MRRTVLMLFWATVAGCDGSTGPQGPQGPAGPEGNANVVAGTFTLENADYVNDFWRIPIEGGTYGHRAKVATTEVAAITAEIVDNGLVLVYVRTRSEDGATSPTQWTLLPFHQIGPNGGFLMSLVFGYDAGTIRIGYLHQHTDADPAMPVPDVYTFTLPAYEFKYVIASGEVAASLIASGSLQWAPELVR